MIFSALFKANWQSKKAHVRLTAIADELQLSNTDHVTILTTMATSDNNQDVRKAALLKLNNINVYIDLLQQTNNKDSAFIQLQIESFLLANNNDVDQENKHRLLALLPKAFLEQWLIHENTIEIAKALHQKINKPQYIVNGFAKSFIDNSMTESFQLFLLANINDISLLEKLTKKTSIAPVKQYIQQQISDLTSAKQKPVQLAKSVQLVLSKLLALKESKIAFTDLIERRETLQNEWQQANTEFNYLTETQQTTFTDKYERINTQLDKIFAPLKEQHEQALITQALTAKKNTAKQQFDLTINELEQQISNAVFENNDLTGSKFESQLNDLPHSVTSSVLNETDQQQYLQQIAVLQKKLQQLPEIAKSVTDATHLISRISQLTIPSNMNEMSERSDIYYAWLKEWKVIEKQSVGTLAESIKNAKNEIVKQWQAGLLPFEKEQKALFIQVQKTITDIKRLIANGKFNPCFGLYKKLKIEFSLLSVSQQQKLQRGFEQVTEKLNDLSDWEQYVATPKKQELLNDIKKLVAQPLVDLNEQANLVKAFRKQWNSLGHAADDIEKKLNDEFNQFCEQAFIPCREFYAQQESIRKKHADQRLLIIDQIHQLAKSLPEESNHDSAFYKSLDAQLNKINKLWRDVGEVDKKQYHQLQKQYKTALAPIKSRTTEYQQNNALLKQQIIDQANQYLESDNVYTAVNDIKKLQQQWRSIGYAGPKQDNTLWQTFRNVNDKVFTKRDLSKAAQDNAQSKIKSEFSEQVKQIKALVSDTTNFQETLAQAQQLLKQVITAKPVIKSIASDLEKLIHQIENKINNNKQHKQTKQWLHIFELLNELSNGITTEQLISHNSFEELPSFWQKKLSDAASQTKNGDRVEKTLKLEILARVDSPKEFASERLAMQVQLLQEQMLSGESVDVKALFIDWLLSGQFSSNDQALITRIKTIYC